jgi:Putative DNA-binding domain
MEANGPSRAKAFFDEIQLPENGARFLNELISTETPTYESEFLEFKGAFNLDIKHDLDSLWAKNLSGFANSDGGVVIFGIDAPKCSAKNLSLAQDLAALCEKLKNTLPKITEPPVLGVLIEPYEQPPGSNKGFVVCYVPSSPWRPHQVRCGGQPGLFYIRASDNHIPCNHATLRSLFAPQLIAVMEVYYQMKRTINALGQDSWSLQCLIENKGPATAREIFVRYGPSELFGNATFNSRLWEHTPHAAGAWAVLCKRPVHPEGRILLFDLPMGEVISGNTVFKTYPSTCRISISAQNQAPVDFEFPVRIEDATDPSTKKALPIARSY